MSITTQELESVPRAPLVYSEPPWERIGHGGVRGAVRLFGPGAIIASVSIASGETLFSSRAGALFGYSLLWFILFCAGCKLVQVYTAGRYFVLTGEHPMETWARLPGPRGWFPALLGGMSMLCCPFWMGGLSGMLGTAMNWMFGLDSRPPESQYLTAHLFGTAALISAVVLTAGQSYRMLEVIQTIIVALLVASIMAAVAVAPVDWAAALKGSVLVHLPAYEPWVGQMYPQTAKDTALLTLVVFMGAIGGGPYDYIGYLSFFREKSWGAVGAAEEAPRALLAATSCRGPAIDAEPANIALGKRWLRAPLIDIFTSFLCVAAFTMAFNILGAAILNPKRLVPGEFALLTPQVEFLTQIHPGLKYLYQLGIFMAFWGTIYGAQEVYARTGYESVRSLWSRGYLVPYRRLKLPICLYACIGGFILLWTVKDPMEIVKPSALIGTLACGLWCFAMIWADRKMLPRALRMNALWIILNVVAGLALTGFGVKAIADYLW